MAVRPVVEEVSQLGLESVEGTPVAANRRLLGVGFNLMEAAEFDEVIPQGMAVATAVPIRQNWSTWEISGDSYPDYNALLFLFSLLFGAPTTTTPGGATNARQHVWTPPATAISKLFATIEKGQPGGTAELAAGATMTDLGLSFSRTAAQELSGSGFARLMDYAAVVGVDEVNVVTITGGPTGGTFTVTVNGQTTAGVAYNASAGTLQTALEALSNVVPGDVSVTGSAGGPYTLTWAATFANTNMTVTSSGASLTGGTTPAATTTTTQQGGITDIACVPILAGQVDVYMDTAGAGLGTTKLTTDFAAELSIGGLRGPVWVLNSALPSYKESVALRPDVSLNLELGNDATSRALVSDMRLGTTKFIEIRATGGEIESGQNYSLKIQMAGQVNEAPSAGDRDGASTLPFSFRAVHDPTWNAWVRVVLVNGLASTA